MGSFVLQNARVVSGESVDVVIDSGRVKELVKAGSGLAEQVYDCSGLYISSGWIDFHVHAYPAWEPYGDDPDTIGIKQGVTTLVDAGSCGADRIAELLETGGRAKTNLLAFLNVSRIGLQRTDELSSLEWLDARLIKDAVQLHQAQIVGLKARVSGSVVREQGIVPLRLALEFAASVSLPLMVHIGSAPPLVDDILSLLREGDIITHYLHGKANRVFDHRDKPLPSFIEALRRGLELDVGHGTASFSFRTASLAKQHGIPLGTISTDIYRSNRLNGPVYSLAHVMSKFLCLGYTLEEVVGAVTIRAAARLNKPELGRIQVGEQANITLFSLHHDPIVLTDVEGVSRTANLYIKPEGVVVNGEFIAC